MFGGSASILKIKKPAKQNTIVEIDAAVIEKSNYPAGVLVVNDCVFRNEQLILSATDRTLIYADPPYVISSRRNGRLCYKNELTDPQHTQLATLLLSTRALVAISCYNSSLYDELYKGWRKIEIKTQTRRGPATEVVYFNYPVPDRLHEYTFLGKDKTDRQRIKRKITAIERKLKQLPVLERQAILSALQRS